MEQNFSLVFFGARLWTTGQPVRGFVPSDSSQRQRTEIYSVVLQLWGQQSFLWHQRCRLWGGRCLSSLSGCQSACLCLTWVSVCSGLPTLPELCQWLPWRPEQVEAPNPPVVPYDPFLPWWTYVHVWKVFPLNGGNLPTLVVFPVTVLSGFIPLLASKLFLALLR